MTVELIQGDCLDVLRGMDSDSVDAIVTDPPYGLSFMGRKWDYDVPSEAEYVDIANARILAARVAAFDAELEASEL